MTGGAMMAAVTEIKRLLDCSSDHSAGAASAPQSSAPSSVTPAPAKGSNRISQLVVKHFPEGMSPAHDVDARVRVSLVRVSLKACC